MVQLLMPVLPFCAVLISSAAAWLWSRFMSVRSVHGLHLPFMCEDAARVRAHMLSGLSLALPFMHIVYNSICVTVFNTFQCFLLPDGKYRLTAAPDVVCWEEGEHQAMVAASILATLVYIIGVPTYVLLLIHFAKRHNKLKDPEWLKCVGFLYVRYGTPPLCPYAPRTGRVVATICVCVCVHSWMPLSSFWRLCTSSKVCLVQSPSFSFGKWRFYYGGLHSAWLWSHCGMRRCIRGYFQCSHQLACDCFHPRRWL